MTVRRELMDQAIREVLVKIVQRAHSPQKRGSTDHVTYLVPAGLLEDAAILLGINRDFT